MKSNIIHQATAFRVLLGCTIILAVCGMVSIASARTQTLRVVCYNIEDDINGATTPLPGLIFPSSGGSVTNGGVLEGIGEEIVGPDSAQPIDILALEETTSNPTTVQPIVNALNTFYSLSDPSATNMFSMSAYQATEQAGILTNGNGPNAMVYNTRTVQLVASVPVDPTNGISQLGSISGEYREVMRYQFAPAGISVTPSNVFYVYVSHYKAKTTAADQVSRTREATIIRNDEANHLPVDARVIYLGDYNISTSSEVSYQIILSNKAPNGIQQGQGIDLFNPTAATNIDWSANSLLSLKSETDTALEWRFDIQLMTSNIFYAVPGGLAYVPGTYHIFGNNGTTPYLSSVNNGSNTSLNTNLTAGSTITATQLYQYLTTASDHLPMVADYTITIPDVVTNASPFLITSIVQTNADILVTWATTGGGTTNVVQVNTGNVDGSYTTNFIDISPFIILPGNGGATTNYLDVGAGTNVPSRYYRVRLVP